MGGANLREANLFAASLVGANLTIVTTFRRALEDPGDLGEQVGAAAGELAGWCV